MRRTVVILALLGLLAVVFATPAAAAKPPGNPNELCAEDVYVEQTPFGPFPLPVPSHGGCVSSWATGAVSTAAYAAQCKFLESEGIEYPYAFYGRYLAENRADCIYYLRGFHTGTIEPGPGS